MKKVVKKEQSFDDRIALIIKTIEAHREGLAKLQEILSGLEDDVGAAISQLDETIDSTEGLKPSKSDLKDLSEGLESASDLLRRTI